MINSKSKEEKRSSHGGSNNNIDSKNRNSLFSNKNKVLNQLVDRTVSNKMLSRKNDEYSAYKPEHVPIHRDRKDKDKNKKKLLCQDIKFYPQNILTHKKNINRIKKEVVKKSTSLTKAPTLPFSSSDKNEEAKQELIKKLSNISTDLKLNDEYLKNVEKKDLVGVIDILNGDKCKLQEVLEVLKDNTDLTNYVSLQIESEDKNNFYICNNVEQDIKNKDVLITLLKYAEITNDNSNFSTTKGLY